MGDKVLQEALDNYIRVTREVDSVWEMTKNGALIRTYQERQAKAWASFENALDLHIIRHYHEKGWDK